MIPYTNLIQSTIENELLLESWIGVILDCPIMNDNWLVWHKTQDTLRKEFTKKMGNIFFAYLVFISLWVPGARLTSTKASGFPPSRSALAKFWYVDVIWNRHFAQSLIVGSDVMWPSPPNTKLDLPSPRAPWGRDSWPGGRSGSCTWAGPVRLGPSPWTWPPHLTSWVAVPRIGAMTSLVTAVIEEVVFSQAFLFCCVHFFEFDW